MITEWFISIGVAVGDWFLSLIPDWDVPLEIQFFDVTLNAFFDQFVGVGVWAPWALLAACILIAVGSWVIGITVKGLRAIASYIPFIGGAG